MPTIPSQIAPPSSFNPTLSTRDVGGSRDTVKASDFLKLLVAQLSNQDPLDPMDDKEFMAQMAQFTSLEEMSSLNKTMSNFVQNQQASAASAYLGRDVTILRESGSGIEVEGSVTAIKIGKGSAQVEVNGKYYDSNRIQTVKLSK